MRRQTHTETDTQQINFKIFDSITQIFGLGVWFAIISYSLYEYIKSQIVLIFFYIENESVYNIEQYFEMNN